MPEGCRHVRGGRRSGEIVMTILGEEHPYGTTEAARVHAGGAQQAPHQNDDGAVGTPASPAEGAQGNACPDCGQLAMVAEHGLCACQQVEASPSAGEDTGLDTNQKGSPGQNGTAT